MDCNLWVPRPQVGNLPELSRSFEAARSEAAELRQSEAELRGRRATEREAVSKAQVRAMLRVSLLNVSFLSHARIPHLLQRPRCMYVRHTSTVTCLWSQRSMIDLQTFILANSDLVYLMTPCRSVETLPGSLGRAKLQNSCINILFRKQIDISLRITSQERPSAESYSYRHTQCQNPRHHMCASGMSSIERRSP